AEFLGRDLAKIAREKSGIMKRHTPVITARQSELVGAVLRSEAQKTGAKLSAYNEDFRAYVSQGRLVFEDDSQLMDLPLPSLIGSHQIENAGVAIAAAKALLISDKAIGRGLTNVSWPARMQKLTMGPLAKTAQDNGSQLWLDGGHNRHAALAIAASLADLEAQDPRPLILIMGILANKDAGGYLDALEGLAGGLVAVPIEGHASLAPPILTELARTRGMETGMADDVTLALSRALDMGKALGGKAPRILICGSLYLAGRVLSL
ncbi:MAG: bifunctional folylpolyglutamate synthase/dihydrofolate synthase, partial [Robiginitomaculum sp.]